MSTTHRAPRQDRTPRRGRLATLFGYREDRPARPLVHVGGPGFGGDVYIPPEKVRQPDVATVTMPVVPESPLHMCPDEGNVMPCCGLTPFDVPRTDRVTINARLVTCRTSAHDTMPDDRARMDRPFAPANKPEPRRHTPDIAADLAALPLFREAVERRTRHGARECLCSSPVGGQAWGERMVRAGMHLTGMDASRILDAAPHLTIPAAVALSDEEAAA